ncbi:MAG: type II toxin-antitoxin system HicB family antitoxin [Candidatus Roizmanbacteria bacterium]
MAKKQENILKYEVVFEEQNGGGYSVTVPILPGCISEGDTFEEAKSNIAEAITAYLESLVIDGEEIPEPNLATFVGPIEVNRPSMHIAIT